MRTLFFAGMTKINTGSTLRRFVLDFFSAMGIFFSSLLLEPSDVRHLRFAQARQDLGIKRVRSLLPRQPVLRLPRVGWILQVLTRL
jgi:hypothetical protein